MNICVFLYIKFKNFVSQSILFIPQLTLMFLYSLSTIKYVQQSSNLRQTFPPYPFNLFLHSLYIFLIHLPIYPSLYRSLHHLSPINPYRLFLSLLSPIHIYPLKTYPFQFYPLIFHSIYLSNPCVYLCYLAWWNISCRLSLSLNFSSLCERKTTFFGAGQLMHLSISLHFSLFLFFCLSVFPFDSILLFDYLSMYLCIYLWYGGIVSATYYLYVFLHVRTFSRPPI